MNPKRNLLKLQLLLVIYISDGLKNFLTTGELFKLKVSVHDFSPYTFHQCWVGFNGSRIYF